MAHFLLLLMYGMGVFLSEKLGDWMMEWGLGARIPDSSAQTTTSEQQLFSRQTWDSGRGDHEHDLLDDDDLDDIDLTASTNSTTTTTRQRDGHHDIDTDDDYNDDDYDHLDNDDNNKATISKASVGW
ncbi:uncharacterized protein BO95DRAFT_428009 [Aspergillus brunneoviolaceus CBS 621.78]|uniref:Uncharacterized protein n=1 Tax=Aspergillus brunneoviolaceus CBS 621.78 TaxID=1450534 RepID=A0ACD1GLH9_9EURO|nr:hypothetical protein BO95DRAFT_428009 [Aspergillus brunneoviolaceus CBS 621.78]RAH50093.1 hypothetical protein BO95DRAFT_428009 [Aspergillus brunneoviolaceus CBS 621.78]